MIKSGAIYECPTIEIFRRTVRYLIENGAYNNSEFLTDDYWRSYKRHTYIALRNSRMSYGNTKSESFSTYGHYGYELGDYPARLPVPDLFADVTLFEL